jgi:hypothetical protein
MRATFSSVSGGSPPKPLAWSVGIIRRHINKETSVLKKLGIVAAAATAGMLALSPLAFATDKYDGGDGGNHTELWYDDHSGDSYQSTYCVYKEDASDYPLLTTITLGAGALLGSGDSTDNKAQNCSNFGDGSSWRYAPGFGE